MSAIVKPFFTSNAASLIRPATQVNLDHVAKFDVGDAPEGGSIGTATDAFQIVFVLANSFHKGGDVIWTYTDEGERDADLAAINVIVTNTV